MELFTLILSSAIFLESTALCVSQFGKKKLNFGKNRRKVFVDTSVLIDGRILSVAKAGFLGDEILIPRSVVRELQLLADGPDSDKRIRARYGLDVINELERVELADVKIYPDDLRRIKVDERLLELAREQKAMIMTNDYNLIKVAQTEHIDCINVNELAQGLRTEYLPGDKLKLKIVALGSNPKQGIAYLPDGTMVVVDNADKYVGKNEFVDIEFVRYLQTNAGKMMFAKLIELPKQQNKSRGRKAPAKVKTQKNNTKNDKNTKSKKSQNLKKK